jgi:chromate transporter
MRLANPALALILFAVALVVVWRVKGLLVTPGILAAGAVAGALVTL